MNKEFIPYEQALELKELGFDDKCLTSYNPKKELVGVFDTPLQNDGVEVENCFVYNSKVHESFVAAPLYQQAFRWFREMYQIYPDIVKSKRFSDWICEWRGFGGNFEVIGAYNKYEEAELACLKKLIEIAKNK